MSAIEDSRKVLQDFLAPELRAIAVRLDALEKRFEDSDRRTEKHFDTIDKRLDEVDQRAERRHEAVMAGLRQVIDLNSIQQRLARLESKEAPRQ